MCSQKSENEDAFGLTDQNRWALDDIIMRFWECKNEDEKHQVELDCYKQFKAMNFDTNVIDYLIDNSCTELATEMDHFSTLFQKVPHTHEKRLAA